MPSNVTQNYHLNQWEPGDRVLRTDFNADNAKIDAALAALAEGKADVSAVEALTQTTAQKVEIIAGTYTGDGGASKEITLGVRPKAVFICDQTGCTYRSVYGGFHYGGLVLSGARLRRLNSSKKSFTIAEVTSNGFRVYETDVGESIYIHCNESNTVYHYLALV